MILLTVFITNSIVLGCGQDYVPKGNKLIVLPYQSQLQKVDGQPHGMEITPIFQKYDQRTYRMILTLKNYVKKIIKVDSQSVQITGLKCLTYSNEEVFLDQYNNFQGDLLLFVYVQEIKNASFTATAAPCVFRKRPVVGSMVLNTHFLKVQDRNAATYQDNLLVMFHQLNHILGFNRQSYLNPQEQAKFRKPDGTIYSQDQTLSQIKGRIFIILPEVKEYISSHFGCDKYGALLENDGGKGTANSHWQRTLFYDQFMTGSGVPGGQLKTGLTLRLLKATGWYSQIDYSHAQQITFGKGQGCSFIQRAINGSCTQNLPYVKQSGIACHPDGNGIVQYITDGFIEGNCHVGYMFYNSICINISSYEKTSTYQSIGAYSRCYESNIGNTNQPFKCFKTTCSSTTSITIQATQNITCQAGEQGVKKTVAAGTLTCPLKIQNYCSRKDCPDRCLANGMCSKGQCICADGYYGDNCGNKCQKLFDMSYFCQLEKKTCVSQCDNLMLFEQYCVESCPTGTKLQGSSCKIAQSFSGYLQIVVILIISEIII